MTQRFTVDRIPELDAPVSHTIYTWGVWDKINARWIAVFVNDNDAQIVADVKNTREVLACQW